MRDNEKHLVDIPLKQLSRASHLIRNLRENQAELSKYKSWQKLELAIFDYPLAYDGGEIAILKAFADLVSEAIWPE